MRIKVITSFFEPLNNANAFVITNKVKALSKYHRIFVETTTAGKEKKSDENEHTFTVNRFSKMTQLISNQFRRTNVDVIISYHHNFISAYASMLHKIWVRKKWIAILSDPPNNISPFIDYKLTPMSFLSYNIPMRLIAIFADSVVFNDDFQQEYFCSRYQFRGKKYVNQMGFSNLQIFKRDKKNKNIVFSYLGDLYGVRNAFEILKTINDNYMFFHSLVSFNFYGDFEFSEEEYYSIFPNISGIVRFQKKIEKHKLNEIYIQTDILLVIDANLSGVTDIYPYTPSKIIDYLSTDLPIFGLSMDKSPTKQICLSTGNWWSDFSETNIFNELKNCINNHTNYHRDSLSCNQYYIENTIKELNSIIYETVSK